jgi:hypothetical protein
MFPLLPRMVSEGTVDDVLSAVTITASPSPIVIFSSLLIALPETTVFTGALIVVLFGNLIVLSPISIT